MTEISQPQQQRSRESFARVRAATLELLAEKGPAGVTIAQVSKRAGVSVGSIYGRVGSRSALLAIVQQEELERIVTSMSDHLAALEAQGENSVTNVTRTFVNEMRESSASIRAMVSAAVAQREHFEAGVRSWRTVRGLVVAALLGAEEVPQATVAPDWADWIFGLMDSSTVNHLEASAPPTPADTEEFVALLSRTVAVLLVAGPSDRTR